MDEQEQKICPNCKREIPAVNFTIHTVHCARNIKVCPVCKEPVPQSELQEHHDKLHKLLPCKQCGESVCGTDLEDHIRDSCGHTIKSCRYCELELPRRELPTHENYCGVRTEQCPDCKEYVMIKYRQLHLDSNHGFLRLDDDPVPQPKKESPRSNLIKPLKLRPNVYPAPSTSNGIRATTSKNINVENDRPKTEIKIFSKINAGASSSSSTNSSQENLSRPQSAQGLYNGVKVPLKRTNDQPQINTAVEATSKVNKDFSNAEDLGSGEGRRRDAPHDINRLNNRPKFCQLGANLGAVKKRPAPRPPARDPPKAEPKRDQAYYSAMQRLQAEEKRRQEQSAYNVSIGLPPVLSPAAKLEKLRKMDALHNREVDDQDYKNRLQSRVRMPPDIVGDVLGSGDAAAAAQNSANLEADRRRHQQRPTRAPKQANNDDRRNEFRDVKPMTQQEFMDRFKELQVRKDSRESSRERKPDRFNEIKTSLRELRRGLNEVTAPYNANNINLTNANNYGNERNERRERNSRRSSPLPSPLAEDEVQLPCEFCGAPVPAYDLVRHQTGCRPDLTQYKAASPARLATASPPPVPPLPRPLPLDEPVIPCEFCAESLPLYLISEHQERCGREANLLYPD
ncbi:uncharacterized protein LOC113225474 [Hyposmocoma kahamanoa]|uniref:uncharacterized protein LOC113225474 n=1 Tax=Hyposmocoma kahamanoa TaxID=1477025 RepID=UPI000E6D69F6|nr:uncharacterized protein LOC113225474 [Hyposmocoma kahamanoa]